MNNRIMATVCVSVAVLAASVAAIVVTNNRATVARAQAAKAESREAIASSEAKKAKADAATEQSRQAAKEAEAKSAEEQRKARELELQTAKANEAAETAAAERARQEAQKARDEAQTAADARAEAKAKESAAKAELEKTRVAAMAEVAMSNAVAQAAADALAAERVRAEKTLAEAKLYEDRKIDFETWQARLLELEQELAEQKRALTPDVGINDSTNIVWVADREADIIGVDTNALARLKRPKVRPENDLTLPEATRKLSRMERELREEVAGGLSSASNKVIKSLTRLYVQAVRDGRVVDAQFFRQSIKHYYPNWEYKP